MTKERKRRTLQLLQQAITATANEYCQQTSLNGFGLLHYIRRRKYQRLCWFMFIALGIACATYVVLYTLAATLGDPTVTSPHAPYALIWELPFPALAVCSTNKLSRRALWQHAAQLAQHDDGYTVDEWAAQLRTLAALYDAHAALNVTLAVELEHEMPLNASIVQLLEQLAPRCDDLLLACQWAGERKNCTELFTPLATPSGHCCAFNYNLSSSPQGDTLRPAGTQPAQGLTLRLNGSTLDYVQEGRDGGGGGTFTLQIFDPLNFPDIDAGYMQQLSATAGEHIAVQLYVATQRADADARAVSKQRRRCLYADEDASSDDAAASADHTLLPLVYSHANCLARCKVRAIVEQCGCVVHYATTATPNSTTTPVCTLRQLPCVRRQRKAAWHAARCGQCMPLCNYQRYEQQTQRVWPPPASGEELLVQLYYPTMRALYTYRKDVIYTWYQVLSNIGGVLGICMGCSFISGFELVYFLAYRLPVHYRTLRAER